jgi:hypothetical protein
MSKYHKAPLGLFKWTKYTKENESILLMLVLLHLFLYSYNFLFQIQSSSLTDSPAKSKSRGSGIFSPIQCCNISPQGAPHLPGVIKVLNHATLTDYEKYNVYLFTTTEHSIPWTRLFEM